MKLNAKTNKTKNMCHIENDMSHIKKQGGITLIALVVTIVVLLILAGVSINAIIGDEGIVNKAKEAQIKMNEAQQNDRNSLSSLSNWLDEALNEIVDNTTSGNEEENTTGGNTTGENEGEQQETIDTETSYVGYYADFEGDGEVDGIIYADLLIGGSGQWENGTYTIPTITESKDYYISQESYKPKNASEEELAFESKPVLTPIAGEKAERFYVMELSDVTSTETTSNCFCWYDAAYDNEITEYESVTSTAFGTGKNNTTVMINAWNDSVYGAKNDNTNGYKDMWGYVKEGWFVPSKDEWSAFADVFDIASSNYENYGLEYYYWSSSLSYANGAWCAGLYEDFMSSQEWLQRQLLCAIVGDFLIVE